MSARHALAGVLLATCLAPAVHAHSEVASEDSGVGHGWVGHIVPPYPSGWNETSGSCIGSAGDEGGPCHHSIAEVRDGQSGSRMIVGLEQAKSFGKAPLWRIAAVLEPDALFDREVAVVHGSCQLRGADDGTVVALVRPAEREWLPAREAWRFDVASGRFAPLAPAGVRCRNEGFGYDG